MEEHQSAHPRKSNQHLIATLIYLLDILGIVGILVSFIFLLFSRKNSFIRFHAMQSLLTFLCLFVLGVAFAYIPVLSVRKLLITLLGLLEIGVWVLLMIKAYQNTLYKLPYIGNLAESLLKKVG